MHFSDVTAKFLRYFQIVIGKPARGRKLTGRLLCETDKDHVWQKSYDVAVNDGFFGNLLEIRIERGLNRSSLEIILIWILYYIIRLRPAVGSPISL